MLRLPLATASTKRACPSRGKVRRSTAHCGLRILGCTIARKQIGALLDLFRREFRRALLSCCVHAEERETEARGHKSVRDRLCHSGISANVVTEPPAGMRS